MLARLCIFALALSLSFPLHAESLAPATQPEASHVTLITEGKIPAIKTAATLDELKKIEPLTLGDCRYRIALQSETIPFGEGILLYALWDGTGTPPQRSNIYSEDDKFLGPFRVTLTRKKLDGDLEVLQDKSSLYLRKNDKIDRRAGECLHLAPIIPPRPGTYEITLTDAEDNTFARTTILCKENKTPHAFYPIDSGETKTAPRTQAPVLPKWDDAELFEIPKSLPTFFPTNGAPALKASLKDGQITLTASSDIFTSIDDNLLVRIWINNQPLNAVEIQDRTEKLKEKAARLTESVTFPLSLDPADYSAKPGDSVVIQFLYTAEGYVDAPRDEKGILREKFAEKMQFLRSPSFSPVLLSNRLTLIPVKK